VVELKLRGGEARSGVAIPLPADATGWGKVELPADDNPADNVFCVTYGTEPVRKSVVVAEDEGLLRLFALAAEAPLKSGIEYVCTPLPMARAAELDLAQVCLLVWQGPLPPAALRERIDAYVDLGGRVLFLPPLQGPGEAYRSLQWGEWVESTGELMDAPVTWREDADLLANAEDGKPLPLGRLEIYGSRRLNGQGTVLGRLRSERPLLLRAPTDRGGVYFLSVLPTNESSNLARQGIVLVAMVQRALEDGVKALRPGASIDAGTSLGDRAEWQQVLRYDDSVLSLEQELFPGVLRKRDRLLAVNRPVSEDATAVLDRAAITDLFQGTSITISVNDTRDESALVEEIWKLLLLMMALALVVEAMLSLADMAKAPK
jgi:hypothetical protein